MAVEHLEHIGIVVDDLDDAIEYFEILGLEVEGRSSVEGEWVDKIIGIDGTKNDFAVMQTPDGQGKIELIQFHSPAYAGPAQESLPSHAPGIRHILFRVNDIDDTVARLQARGAELVGSVENYQDMYKLCYIRGPQGIIVELAERLGGSE
jgi:catechol 2,3-dioxygenase-like lactoylglutathione lyase family enzyme